ncbi:hypothetical protein [Rickettsia bellii]|nr:hypothetical protein [Rickettsia bellii]
MMMRLSIPILQEFVKQVCNTTNIDRVVVGLGGKTPKKFKELEIKFPEIILEGFSYGDAKEQALIWQKPELTELENKINGYITKTEYKFELNRIDRAKALLDLIENEPNFSDFLNNSNHNLLKLLNLSAVSTDLKNFNYEYFKEFSNLNLNIIKRLVDDNRALEGYSKKFFTLEKLKDLPLDKIKILTQRHKFNSYEQNIFNFDDLKDLNIEEIKLLTSSTSIEGYENKYFTFNDFKGLNTKKIKALRGEEAVNGYSKEYFIFDELKNLDTALIKMLVSDEARSGYLDKYFTFDDLKNLDIDLIKVLTDRNNFINKGYEKQLFTFNDLKVLNIDTLKILTSSNILEGYEKQLFTFNDLKVLSSDKLKIATSPNIIDCYQLNYFKFKDFVELDVEKMQAIYDNIRGCQRVLSEEHCTFNDLKNVDPNKIKALTESIVILGYKSKYFTFNGLKDISLEKIQTLTSKEALIKYGSKDLKFEDFKASLEIADDHKTEMSEVSSFTDLVINNHEENVDIIGRDL